MKKIFLGGLVWFGAAVVAVVVSADVRLAKNFTDNAVLQRDIPVAVWGWADSGEEVTVTFGEQSAKTAADVNGRWLVRLPAMKGSAEPRELGVVGKNTIRLQNVVVGEVWLCSGQSNMQWTMSYGNPAAFSGTEEEVNGDYSTVRFNGGNRIVSQTPLGELDARGWIVCKDGAQKDCTAVGFHFGIRLAKELGVPVGLIDSAWGGSNIHSWLPEESWVVEPQLAPVKSEYDERVANSDKYRQPILEEIAAVEADTTIPEPDKGQRLWFLNFRKDTIGGEGMGMYGGMYNAMIAPWTNYTIRGVIWYQGESNASDGEFYFVKQKTMIEMWRKIWNQGDFPFYWVQLANFLEAKDEPSDTGEWPALRDGQTQTLVVPNTGQAVILDVGDAKDIHPLNKFDVGNRLALWALANQFGCNLEPQSPTLKEMKIDGDCVTLTFDHVGAGLMVGQKEGRNPVVRDNEGKLARFAIAGDDQKWVWADAEICGNNSVTVRSDGVKNPVAVRYAWQMNPAGANLYSTEGLPTTPFRTDSW